MRTLPRPCALDSADLYPCQKCPSHGYSPDFLAVEAQVQNWRTIRSPHSQADQKLKDMTKGKFFPRPLLKEHWVRGSHILAS